MKVHFVLQLSSTLVAFIILWAISIFVIYLIMIFADFSIELIAIFIDS